MQLLDTWLTIFQADTSSLQQGTKRSEKGADDLIKKLKETDRVADRVGGSFAGYAKNILGTLAAAASVNTLIAGTIGKAQDITQIAQTAEALDIAVEELDAFGRAAAALGGDAQGARDSVTDMAESIGEALQDVESGRAKTFSALGISLRGLNGQAKDGITGILDLADAVQGLSKQEAVFRIKELGITDNRTVEMVLKGRKELERLLAVQKAHGVVTKESAAEAKKFTEGLNILRGSVDSAGTGFMSAMIPALTKVVEWLTVLVNWAGENSNVIVGFFGAVAAIVTAVYLPAMISAAVATLAATWPLLLIIGIIGAVAAAFALLYDDVMNFVDGNDSLIGQIFEKYPMVKQVVYGLIDAFKLFADIVSGVWQVIRLGFEQMLNFVTAGIKKITGAISTVGGFFGFSVDTPDENPTRQAAGSDVPELPTRQAAVPPVGVEIGQEVLKRATASPLNATSSAAISNSVASSKRETNVQVGELKVVTQATDADGISRDIGGSLSDQLEQLDNEFASGVAR